MEVKVNIKVKVKVNIKVKVWAWVGFYSVYRWAKKLDLVLSWVWFSFGEMGEYNIYMHICTMAWVEAGCWLSSLLVDYHSGRVSWFPFSREFCELIFQIQFLFYSTFLFSFGPELSASNFRILIWPRALYFEFPDLLLVEWLHFEFPDPEWLHYGKDRICLAALSARSWSLKAKRLTVTEWSRWLFWHQYRICFPLGLLFQQSFLIWFHFVTLAVETLWLTLEVVKAVDGQKLKWELTNISIIMPGW